MSCAAARYDRQKVHVRSVPEVGVPKGIRTPVTAVKGRCPGPLDDGDAAVPRRASAEDYTAYAQRTTKATVWLGRSTRRGPAYSAASIPQRSELIGRPDVPERSGQVVCSGVIAIQRA